VVILGDVAEVVARVPLSGDEVEAAVDGDDLSGDPIAGRVGQRDDPAGDVVGCAAPAEGDAAGLVSLDRIDRLGWQSRVGQDRCLGRPGATALTRMPSGASSIAQLRVRASSAALLAP
jgi:hypothetical protein